MLSKRLEVILDKNTALVFIEDEKGTIECYQNCALHESVMFCKKDNWQEVANYLGYLLTKSLR